MLTSMRALGVRSELTDIDPGHFEGAVETHEHPRSQLTDRTITQLSSASQFRAAYGETPYGYLMTRRHPPARTPRRRRHRRRLAPGDQVLVRIEVPGKIARWPQDLDGLDELERHALRAGRAVRRGHPGYSLHVTSTLQIHHATGRPTGIYRDDCRTRQHVLDAPDHPAVACDLRRSMA
jgi:hypothetical protein